MPYVLCPEINKMSDKLVVPSDATEKCECTMSRWRGGGGRVLFRFYVDVVDINVGIMTGLREVHEDC